MKLILLFIVAYLLGSIPSGVWVGKLFLKRYSSTRQRQYWHDEYIQSTKQNRRNHCFVHGYPERNIGNLSAVYFPRYEH